MLVIHSYRKCLGSEEQRELQHKMLSNTNTLLMVIQMGITLQRAPLVVLVYHQLYSTHQLIQVSLILDFKSFFFLKFNNVKLFDACVIIASISFQIV